MCIFTVGDSLSAVRKRVVDAVLAWKQTRDGFFRSPAPGWASAWVGEVTIFGQWEETQKKCFYENLTERARFKPKLCLIYICIYINGTQEPTLLMSKYRIARQGEERTSSPVH